MTTDRFDLDNKGELDDVVVIDVEMFRFERMDEGLWWMRCYRNSKPDIVFWLSAKGKIKATHEIEE